MTTTARNYLDMALLQTVAESYLHLEAGQRWSFLPPGQEAVELAVILRQGSNHPNRNAGGDGATGLTDTQQDYFGDNYEIVMHYPNDASGFSATLFERKNAAGHGTGEFFRVRRVSGGNSGAWAGRWLCPRIGRQVLEPGAEQVGDGDEVPG
ncbi:MAG: hypothetical protein KBF48_05370, partial [Xanthomonadales bacterium]|nr:hypothetical protein [Xanthomonadales bacterium]